MGTSVSCIRDAEGRVERFISQIIDVTAEVEARRQIEGAEREEPSTHARTAGPDRPADRRNLTAPPPYRIAATQRSRRGPSPRHLRYQPSLELAGDSHDYNWIDDDHLIVVPLDVSGHGVAAALQSISVHNMLRSASCPTRSCWPRNGFSLNSTSISRWTARAATTSPCGTACTRSQRAHCVTPVQAIPPALMSTADTEPVQLDTEGVPVGMFDHTVFPAPP